jgi:methylmalonyl-CoA/ethylmalonyl-CoA epimerase
VSVSKISADLDHGRRFHHLGVAVRDLDREERLFAAVGYRRESGDFVDEHQGVRIRFVVGGGPRLELLQQLPGRVVLDPWLRRGIRFYHMAWECDAMQAEVDRLMASGARLVSAPAPAVAFGGRRVCFLFLGGAQLIELIEAEPRDGDQPRDAGDA